MTRTSPADLGDGWYESEEPMRLGMISELQRMKDRARQKPIRVLLLAALITGAVTYKLAAKQPMVEAQITLALSEGDFSTPTGHAGLAVDQLKEDFTGKLLPDAKLMEIIKRRNLFTLRRKLGDSYALNELKSQMEIEIWRNSFAYFDEDEQSSQRSARIGITYADTDPDRAYGIARDIADIAIDTFEERRIARANKLAGFARTVEEDTRNLIDALDHTVSVAQAAMVGAQQRRADELIANISLRLATLTHQRKRLDERLGTLARSNDTFADDIAAAGLDISLTIVDEHVPEHTGHSLVVTIATLLVVGAGSLLASILLVGAFDSRIHDTADVSRLGLPVLGHVPGFPGDNVGAMRSRGAARARVGSFERWRSRQ
jgi:hypothetical protein